MSDETKNVAKRSPTEIEAMKALQGTDFTGYEGMKSDMLNTPFLKIAQTTTIQVDDREDKNDPLEAGKIPGLRPGMFYNSQTGRILETEKNKAREIKVIALFAKSSYLHYGEGLGNFKGEYSEEKVNELVKKGILQKDPDSPGWVDTEKGKCFFAITFYTFLPDFPEEGILPFVTKGKSLKYAKGWNSLSNGMPIVIGKEKKQAARFQLVWKISLKKDTNDKGNWYNIGDKTGSGIEFIGNIFQPEYSSILPALADAVELVKIMKDKQLNYATESPEEPKEEKNSFED